MPKGEKKGPATGKAETREEPENVVNLLLDIQEKDNYLSEQAMRDLAKREDLPAVNVYGVATFYAQFKLTKPGRYVINVCKGTACHVKNADDVLEHIQEHLGIKKGETTKDGKFSLHTVNCIGACAKAPAMMINGVVYGELTKEKAVKILESLK